MANVKESAGHDHHHGPNRFAVVPTAVRLNADPDYTGKGVTIAFLDSGFYPHSDLQEPDDRILAYHNQAAEEAISQGVVVVAAAGNAGAEGKHSIPPANSPSVITVGGYDDKNDLDPSTIDLYQSNFGPTADGTVKPEIIAPAMWIAAPILPGTELYEKAETLSRVLGVPDYELGKLC